MRYAGKGSGWGVLTGEEAQLLLTKKKRGAQCSTAKWQQLQQRDM